MVIKKCKDLLQKKLEKNEGQSLSKTSPCLEAQHQGSKEELGGNKLFLSKFDDFVESSEISQSNFDKFDTRDYLKCYKFNKKSEEQKDSTNPYSFVLNNNKIANFIRQSKKRKASHRKAKWHDECTDPKP